MTTPRPTPTRPGRPVLAWLAAALLLALAAAPVLWRYLVDWPQDQWQVDLEVYRQAGVSVLAGTSVYDAVTEAPQLLPFTYPPFAAALAVPLALVPFGVVGWWWSVAQVLATAGIVAVAAGPLLARVRLSHPGRWPLVLVALTAPMLWLHPVADGVRFGQVNAFLVLACLLDLVAPRPRWLRHVPPGVLVGLATAVKLTPGVFIVHYLLNRRWREAAAAIGSAAAATLATFAVLPRDSWDFWWSALRAPDRLGPNAGTSNQSLRGVLLRIGPDGTAGTVLWAAVALAVAVAGYVLARRLWRAGDTVGEVATLGMLAVLLSPVAWIHHLHWVVVAVFAVLGSQASEDRRRVLRRWLAVGLTAWFLCRLPWWGITWMADDWWPHAFGRLLQNADCLAALLVLVALWRLSHPAPAAVPDSSRSVTTSER